MHDIVATRCQIQQPRPEWQGSFTGHTAIKFYNNGTCLFVPQASAGFPAPRAAAEHESSASARDDGVNQRRYFRQGLIVPQ